MLIRIVGIAVMLLSFFVLAEIIRKLGREQRALGRPGFTNPLAVDATTRLIVAGLLIAFSAGIVLVFT